MKIPSIAGLSILSIFLLGNEALANDFDSHSLKEKISEGAEFRAEFGLNSNEQSLMSNSEVEFDEDSLENYGVLLTKDEVNELEIRQVLVNDAIRIKSEILEEDWNENYAGVYIDQQRGGKLVFAFTDDDLPQENVSEIMEKESFNYDERVEYITVDHTDKELQEVSDNIFNNKENLEEEHNFIINGVAPFFMDQHIKIFVDDVNQDVEQVMSDLYPNFDFVVEEASFEEENNPGVGIRGNGSCTAGFPAQSGSNYYLVTAAHCTGSSFTTASGTTIGTRSSISQNSGTVDAVGINATYNNLSSNLQYGSGSLSSSQPVGGELLGQSVSAQGATSGRVSSGTLQTISLSFVMDSGTAFSNMRGASYSSTSGDSGGTVHNGSELLGIHKGQFSGFRAYTHVTNIESVLGLSPVFP